MAKIVILGSGGWGIALGLSANDSGNQVTLWTPFSDEAKMLEKANGFDLMNRYRLCIISVELESSGQKYKKRWNSYG